MKAKGSTKWAAVLALGAAGLCGCVAIPCGTETFTTEYQDGTRAVGAPEKSWAPKAEVRKGAGMRGVVEVGLSGEVTETQAQEQAWKKLTLTKRKRLAIGLFPEDAEKLYRPKEALQPQGMMYLGNGVYGTPTVESEKIAGGFPYGKILCLTSLGVLPTPFSFLVSLFEPFEHDRHFTGRVLETKVWTEGNVQHGQVVRDGRSLDLLWKFPAKDRKRIGAWTWKENDEHPQNTFWNGFRFQWVGVYKYCTYVVHEPEESKRGGAAEPKVTQERRTCRGPYRVFLEIPELGYARTLEVPRGEERVRFDLSAAADGRARAEGRLRYLPPLGGEGQMWDDDARAMLEAVRGKSFRVALDLPPPRLRAGE